MPTSRDIIDDALRLGFIDIRAARVEPVDHASAAMFEQWIADQRHGSMDYLARYADVRRNPALLLEGARTILVAAINYYRHPSPDDPAIALYASGDDYHTVVRERLESLAETIRQRFGGETRVCVDTAPLRERYWSAQSGLGFIGLNNQLIIPGAGSYFFLGEILSTVEFEADQPLNRTCCRCRKCIAACPGGALKPDGSIDARKCLSYLTIEHRGALPEGTNLKGHLYGCDVCQQVCPHNADARHTDEPCFALRDSYRKLSLRYIAEQMTQEEFSTTFRGSAIKRTKFEGLQRNAKSILDSK